ncbi:hypothetical protein ES705_11122 [subsurface metagenome]
MNKMSKKQMGCAVAVIVVILIVLAGFLWTCSCITDAAISGM